MIKPSQILHLTTKHFYKFFYGYYYFNIKLVIQTQRGGTDIISSKLRGNLQSRILLRVDNNDAAVKMCLGSLDYLEKLGNIDPLSFPYGRFVFLDNSSETGLKIRYGQGSYIEPNEYVNTLKLSK